MAEPFLQQVWSQTILLVLLVSSSFLWPITTAIRTRPAHRPLAQDQESKCEVQSYTLRSDVHLRYSTSMLRIELANPERSWRTLECSLNVVIPETAFLSGVLAEIGDKVIQTKVIERKEENPDEEDEDTNNVEPFEVPRDSKLIKIGVSLKAQEEAILFVSYEQLITRKLGIYEIVLNLHPGQVVQDLRVDAFILESRELTVLRVLGIRSGQEIDPLEGQSEFPLSKIIRPSEKEAHIIFSPSRKQQTQLANSKTWLQNGEENGLSGQLVVQFELSRPKDGEIMLKDGFFAHHYAPTALSVLPKHVVFVLDLSSSMAGRRIAQLKLAMGAILDELKSDDFFSIVQFNSFKSVWRPYGREKKRPKSNRRPRQFGQSNYSNQQDRISSSSGGNGGRPAQKQPADLEGGGRVIPAKPNYIAKAKRYIKRMKASGGTNIQKALTKAIEIAHSTNVPLALIVFLTDGDSTVGETKTSYILKIARDANRKEKCDGYQETTEAPCNNFTVRHVPIYSLAFGEEANIYFLRRLSAENFGTARRIYDAEDAAIQLQEVYAELAAPVQADCLFNYPENMVDPEWVTQHKFAAAFLGSEILVAGRLLSDEEKSDQGATAPDSGDEGSPDFWGEVKGIQMSGEVSTVHLPDSDIEFYPNTKFNPNLSHLWAYLTIYQLLVGSAARDSREEATQIALEYSFVTATTTLQPHFEGDQDDVATSILRVHLPASQEIGNIMGDDKAGSTDVCSEGGEGEYWFPLQQAFIPCGERKVTHLVPSSSQQQSSEFGRNQIHEPNNSIGDKQEDDDDDADFEEDKSEVEQKYQLIDMESLTWLKDVRYGPRYLVLPKGRGGENQLFSLGLNESNEAYAPCLSPLKEPSHCRHLHFCSIAEMKDDFYEFLRFFCSINHFAGVCCPDSLFVSEESNFNK